MSVEKKINFANCRLTQDFLDFSQENSIVDRQSAEDFLRSNRDIPFLIRLCSCSNNTLEYGSNVYAFSKFDSDKNEFSHILIRAEHDAARFYLFSSTSSLISFKLINLEDLVWCYPIPRLCYYSEYIK
jgi:hypothetical protein